jgi:hypothetical protein
MTELKPMTHERIMDWVDGIIGQRPCYAGAFLTNLALMVLAATPEDMALPPMQMFLNFYCETNPEYSYKDEPRANIG